jgi:hypothetical protein
MWTEVEQAVASSEGWGVFNLDDEDGEVRIERLDEEAILSDDGAAWVLVTKRASEGSGLHILALSLVSRLEREKIKAYTGY